MSLRSGGGLVFREGGAPFAPVQQHLGNLTVHQAACGCGCIALLGELSAAKGVSPTLLAFLFPAVGKTLCGGVCGWPCCLS